MTSSLYYAITFVEALLNEEYRRRLEADGVPEEEIMVILKSGSSAREPEKRRSFARKFSEWPAFICAKPVSVSESLRKVLSDFNDIRGNLTHPKSRGYDIYANLERVTGQNLLEAVAEYAVAIYEGLGLEYPYWLFGWNYLNPDTAGYDPARINNQQFLHSLEYLGLSVQAFDGKASDTWRQANMTNYGGYKKISKFLRSCRDCEPCDPNYPFRPRLVRRWWDPAIFEKNEDYIKERALPQFTGTVLVSGMMIAAFNVTEQRDDPSSTAQ
jgi:hypothetical protein